MGQPAVENEGRKVGVQGRCTGLLQRSSRSISSVRTFPRLCASDDLA
jgi:hypothetical protein